jgi:hypothetical protein
MYILKNLREILIICLVFANIFCEEKIKHECYVDKNTGIKLYESPNVQSEVIRVIPDRTAVYVINFHKGSGNDDKWIKLKFENNYGWVKTEYLSGKPVIRSLGDGCNSFLEGKWFSKNKNGDIDYMAGLEFLHDMNLMKMSFFEGPIDYEFGKLDVSCSKQTITLNGFEFTVLDANTIEIMKSLKYKNNDSLFKDHMNRGTDIIRKGSKYYRGREKCLISDNS